MFRSKKLAFVAAGAVAALALGSFAFAAIPDGGGVIHACYKKDTGAVRVTDTDTNLPKGCTSKETALDWNQRGPSNAYVSGWGSQTVPANVWTQVVSRTLPPGKYVVSAKVMVEAKNLNTPPTIVMCGLDASTANASSLDYARGTVSSNASGDVMVATLGLVNSNTHMLMNAGGTVSVSCQAPQAIFAHEAQITAIQVGEIDF